MNEEGRVVIDALVGEALDHWGPDLQRIVTIEELAELTFLLTNALRRRPVRNRDILEEIADIRLMLLSLQRIYNFSDEEVEFEMFLKAKRTKQRIENDGIQRE